MTQVLTTGDENAAQEMEVAVPGRASPLRVRTVGGNELPLTPLSTTLFGDAGTTTPLALQNGSIATPFATLQQVIDAANGSNGFSGLLTPGNYGNATLGAIELSLVGLGLSPGGGGAIVIGQITCDQSSLRVSNANLFADATDSDLHFFNCVAAVDGNGSSSVEFRGSNAQGLVSDVTFAYFRDGSEIQTTVTAGDCWVENSSISAVSITCTGELRLRQLTRVEAGATLTAATISVDAASYSLLIAAGTTIVGALTIVEEGDAIRWGASALSAAPANTLQPWVKTAATAAFAGNQWILIPKAGRIGNLRARVFAVHTQNITFTLFHNLAPTALVVTIPAGSFNAENGTNFLDVAAGDILSLDGAAADGLGAATSIEVELQFYGA